MPYYTTTAAQFDPYSLQDLLAPLTMYKSRWDELEKSYEDMDSKAALLEAQASSDPKTAQMYSVYKEALLAGRDAMMQGLSNKDTSNLLNAKRAYNTNVLPIAEAVAARTSDSEVWRKQKASDPSLLGDDPMSKPLSGYLYGNRPDLHNVSGNALYTKAMNAAKNISSRYFNTEEGKLFKGTYYNLITEKGFPPEIAARALIASGQFQGLTEFYNNLLASEGVDALSQNDQIRAAEYVLSGMDAGFVRDVDMKPLQNPWVAASIKNSSGSGGNSPNSLTPKVQTIPKDLSTIVGKYSIKEIKNKKEWFANNFGKRLDNIDRNTPKGSYKNTTSQGVVYKAPDKKDVERNNNYRKLKNDLDDYNKIDNTSYEIVYWPKSNSYHIGWKDDKGKWHYDEPDPKDKPLEVYTQGYLGNIVSPNVTTSSYNNIDNSIQNNITAASINGNVVIKKDNGKDLSAKDMRKVDISSIHYVGTSFDAANNVNFHITYKIGDEVFQGTITPEAFLPNTSPVAMYDVNGELKPVTAAKYAEELKSYAAAGMNDEALAGLGLLNSVLIDHANTRTPGQSGTNEKIAAALEQIGIGAYLDY